MKSVVLSSGMCANSAEMEAKLSDVFNKWQEANSKCIVFQILEPVRECANSAGCYTATMTVFYNTGK